MPQHEELDHDAIIKYASTPDQHGKMPSRVDVAAKFGINVVTVNKVLLASPQHERAPQVKVREEKDAQAVLREVIRCQTENAWSPSQREIGEACDMMPSRVNYLLRLMHHQGIIELGPNSRQIRIVGSKMVIPEVTM